ncbi:unnamed protein product, partial [Enterobius vermicularis]|uniref:Ubiquitin-like domain-containing protein n=1 Tax=Enterobius vermicularis TaxID=51028 RepID=A0A0N4UTE4_ENTVE
MTDSSFPVTGSDTIQVVKEKIEEIKGIESQLQTLSFQGEELEELRLLFTYDIEEGSVLEICQRPEEKIQIFVKDLTDQSLKFDINLSDHVEVLMNMIKARTNL